MADNSDKYSGPGADFANKNNPFPTDEQLQETKAQRRGWIQKLRDKGVPDAVTDTADKVSDAITPDTQQEYTDQMATSVSPIGSVRRTTVSMSEPEIRLAWNKLSGDAKEAAGLTYDAFKKNFLEEQANSTKQASTGLFGDDLSIVKSKPTEGNTLTYSGQQSQEPRRFLDPSKKFDTAQSVADIKQMAGNPNTSATPLNGLQPSPPPVVQNAVFPKTEQMSHQELMNAKAKDSYLKRMREAGPSGTGEE